MEYPELERQLFKVQLTHPRGDKDICKENDKKWRAVLNRFLVDSITMQAINGDRVDCSYRCLDQDFEDSGSKFNLVDTARFAL